MNKESEEVFTKYIDEQEDSLIKNLSGVMYNDKIDTDVYLIQLSNIQKSFKYLKFELKQILKREEPKKYKTSLLMSNEDYKVFVSLIREQETGLIKDLAGAMFHDDLDKDNLIYLIDDIKSSLKYLCQELNAIIQK